MMVIGTPRVGPPAWSFVRSLLGIKLEMPWLFQD